MIKLQNVNNLTQDSYEINLISFIGIFPFQNLKSQHTIFYIGVQFLLFYFVIILLLCMPRCIDGVKNIPHYVSQLHGDYMTSHAALLDKLHILQASRTAAVSRVQDHYNQITCITDYLRSAIL